MHAFFFFKKMRDVSTTHSVFPETCCSCRLLDGCVNYCSWLPIVCLKETNQSQVEFSSANVDSGWVGGLGAERVQRCVYLWQRRAEEVGEILLSCQPTCVSQGKAEGTQGRWWVGSWMVCWVKYSRSVRVKLFKAWHTCLGAIQAFLLWQHGAREGFPWCHCCFEKVSSGSVLSREWAVGRLWHGERLLPVLLLLEPSLANPSSMWLQLTAIKMCWPKRFNINQSYSRSQFRGFKKERKKKSDANREIEVNICNVSHGLEIEK